MKKLLLVLCLLGSFSTFASTLNCQSQNYTVVVNNIDTAPDANYGINGEMNDGAEVAIEALYVTDLFIALSLNIDGQSGKIELAVEKQYNGELSGEVSFGGQVQKVKCVRN